MKTVAGIAGGYSDSLLLRAAGRHPEGTAEAGASGAGNAPSAAFIWKIC